MITLPCELFALRGFPGYFYDPQNSRMYSIKGSGELRELKMVRSRPMAWNNFRHFAGWRLSVRGRRLSVTSDSIERYLIRQDYQVPYERLSDQPSARW